MEDAGSGPADASRDAVGKSSGDAALADPSSEGVAGEAVGGGSEVGSPLSDAMPFEAFHRRVRAGARSQPTGAPGRDLLPAEQRDRELESPPDRRMSRLKPGPLSRAVVALVVAALALAGLWAAYHNGTSIREAPVLIARANLPAYHVLNSGDVTLGVRPASAGLIYVTLPVDGLVTVHAISKS